MASFGSSLKRFFLQAIGPLVFIFSIMILSLMIVNVVLVSRVSNHVQDITRLWKDQPIVSMYVSSGNQEAACSFGFDALPLDNAALPGISATSCGCTENPYGYSSSIAPCFGQGEHSGYCMPLEALQPAESLRWRGSTLCVKRAGRPAATYKGHYAGRPHPNKHGHCPHGYRKCGEGKNQDEGAICFPDDIECPITNIMILPKSSFPHPNEGWEPAGTFLNDNHVLYFRREHIDELPIMNVTAALTEFVGSRNTRGQCFRGEIQSPGRILGSKTSLWAYNSAFPPVCETPDPRYKLADHLSLEDGYLKSVQVMEPACAGFQLFSLDDPRYNKTSDPDYLNSGVKCDSDPRYVCVRDSNQHTNCIAGDEICDGVINQNICGEYAHAVRSAFSDSTATLGLYYVREIEWSDQCDVSKSAVFDYRKLPGHLMFTCYIGVSYFLLFTCGILVGPLRVPPGTTLENAQVDAGITYFWYGVCPTFAALMVALVNMSKLYALYAAVESGQCTDDFTAEILTSRLYPTPQAFYVTLVLFTLYLVTTVLSMRIICTKSTFEIEPPVVTAPVVVPVANIELAPPVQTARAVETTEEAYNVKGVSVSAASGVPVRENRNSTYGPVSTQEV